MIKEEEAYYEGEDLKANKGGGISEEWASENSVPEEVSV